WLSAEVDEEEHLAVLADRGVEFRLADLPVRAGQGNDAGPAKLAQLGVELPAVQLAGRSQRGEAGAVVAVVHPRQGGEDGALHTRTPSLGPTLFVILLAAVEHLGGRQGAGQ